MTQSAKADPQIITREVARERGLKRFFTGKPCIRGHVVERWLSNNSCVDCVMAGARKAYAADLEKARAKIRKRRAADPEAVREQARKTRAADPDRYRGHDRKARAAYPDRYREYDREARARPLGQLRALHAITAARLNVGKLSQSKMKLFGYGPDEYRAHLESTLPNGMTFDEAREAGYHVDHIVPLAVISEAWPTGKAGRLRALQMADDLDNLCMIPAVENMRKSASFDGADQERLFAVLYERYAK